MNKTLTFFVVFSFSIFLSENIFGESVEVKREYWKKYIFWGKGYLKKETRYNNGKKEGPTKYWYKSGKIKGERNFKNGKENGSLKWWYESGGKMAEVFYQKGKKHGSATWWFPNGNKKKKKLS